MSLCSYLQLSLKKINKISKMVSIVRKRALYKMAFKLKKRRQLQTLTSKQTEKVSKALYFAFITLKCLKITRLIYFIDFVKLYNYIIPDFNKNAQT